MQAIDYQPRLGVWSHVWRYALVVAIGAVAWTELARWQWENDRAWFAADLALGIGALVLVAWRRRWPLTIALVTNAATVISASAGGPATLALVSLATRRRWREIIPVSVLGLAAGLAFDRFNPVSDEPWGVTVPILVALIAITVGWGMYIGSRRELLATLRLRAETAEAEQAARVAQARTAERSRIAREMHDVLAHRISLVTMHAGALSYRKDLTPDQVQETAGIIQDTSHQALVELRQVLGVLREDPGDADPERPQPSAEDLPELDRGSPCLRHEDRDGARGPGRRRSRQHRTRRVQNRPGGADECTQARPGHVGHRGPVGRARRWSERRGPKPPAHRRSSGHAGVRTGAAGAGRAGDTGRRPPAPRGDAGSRVHPHGVATVAGMTRVLITDDDALVRAGLALMLGGAPGLEVVGEAANGAEAVEAVRAGDIDVVLMDLRMPVMDGIAATTAIRALDEAPKVIVLTTFDADEYVVRALAAGANGFLLKDTPPAEIVAAIGKVEAGEPMLSPAITTQLIRQVTDHASDDRSESALARVATLTDRERDVALAVGHGSSNAEIAEQLHLSIATVKAHISHLFLKLEATNRVQVAICMHDAGLL